MPIITIKPAGAAVPKVEKRAAESITYTLDCKEVLDVNELIVSTKAVGTPEGISLSEIRPKNGVTISVRVDNAPINTAQYLDFNISIEFTTISGNRKLAVFQVRAHK